MVSPTNELDRDRQHIPPLVAGNDTNDPEVIRVQIEQTRAHMGHTIEQIQERLSPDRLRRQTKATIREATIGKVEEMSDKAEREVNNWRTKITRTVKENPIPAALIGIGVGWLIVSDNENEAESYPYPTNEYHYYPAAERDGRRQDSRAAEIASEGRDWARERTEDVKERAEATVEQIQDRAATAVESVEQSASEVADQAERRARELRQQVEESTQVVQDRAQQTAHQFEDRARQATDHFETQARRGMRRSQRSFWETMNENPLAVGAAAVALGALVGMALPGTTPEDRWMGETRDQLVDEAKERTQETARKVQTVAQAAAREAAHEAKEAAAETAKQKANEQDLPTSIPEREAAK